MFVGVPRPHRQTPVTARETAAPIPNATANAKARSHANATATPRPSIVAPLGLAPAIHGCRCSRDRRTRPIVVPSSFDQAAHLYAIMIRRRRVMPSIAPGSPTSIAPCSPRESEYYYASPAAVSARPSLPLRSKASVQWLRSTARRRELVEDGSWPAMAAVAHPLRRDDRRERTQGGQRHKKRKHGGDGNDG